MRGTREFRVKRTLLFPCLFTPIYCWNLMWLLKERFLIPHPENLRTFFLSWSPDAKQDFVVDLSPHSGPMGFVVCIIPLIRGPFSWHSSFGDRALFLSIPFNHHPNYLASPILLIQCALSLLFFSIILLQFHLTFFPLPNSHFFL